MAQWPFTKGLHQVGEGVWAYIQPDGSWGWSNAGLVVDGDDTLLIDTLFDVKLTREMLDAMRHVAPAAAHIRTLVNTHANGDHVYGNELVAGAEIISSEATLHEMDEFPSSVFQHLKDTAHDLGEGGAFYAELFEPFDFSNIKLTKPTRTFKGELDIRVGRKPVKLVELGPAHSKGDIIVHLPDDGIVFTGDILFNGGTPISWAGPVRNWIKACDYVLGLNVDIVVPGHGPVTDKSAVVRMRDYLQYVYDEAYKRFKAGMPALEAAHDIPLGDYAKWDDAERIVVTVAALYGEFQGTETHGEFIPFFEQMSKMRRKLKASQRAA